jgi:uncharacterized protein YbjT (DUF2867 family)
LHVAVVGGTGLVGRQVIRALQEMGHQAVVIARSVGVDVASGRGLDEKLIGVEAVVDVTNVAATEVSAARSFFEAVTGRLLAAEQRAGVRHHVVLSICGVDRVEGNAHYAGKRHQEKLVREGAVPFTIQRATHFHDFAAMVVGWNRQGNQAVVPPLLVQPVAVADLGRVLAEVAIGAPSDRTPDLAGPETQDLVDMARRTMAARGDPIKLIPSWRGGSLGVEMAGEVLLPGPDARLAPTTFDSWLSSPEIPHHHGPQNARRS